MSNNLQQDREEIAAANERIEQQQILYKWLIQNPRFNFESAVSVLRAYHNGEPMTIGSLDESAERLVAQRMIKPLSANRVQSDAAKAKIEAADAEQKEREDLTSWILAARVQSDSAEEHEQARFLNPKATAIETLRQIKQNIVAKRELQSKSIPELRQLANAGRVSAPEDLPAHISRNQILHMMDGPALRQLIARWGSAAVNRRIQEDREEE